MIKRLRKSPKVTIVVYYIRYPHSLHSRYLISKWKADNKDKLAKQMEDQDPDWIDHEVFGSALRHCIVDYM